MLKPRKRLTKRQVKEDKLITIYFQVVEFYKQYQNYILGALGVVVIVILLSAYISNTRAQKEQKASATLATARLELANMNIDVAIDSLERLVTEYDGTKSAGTGCFYLANSYFLKKNYDSAQKYYEKYLSSYEDNLILASSAMSGVAACFEEKEEYRQAAEMYQKTVRKYPNVFNVAEKLMNAARCYRLAGVKEEARTIYQQIIDEYPNSGFKNDADIYLSQLNS